MPFSLPHARQTRETNNDLKEKNEVHHLAPLHQRAFLSLYIYYLKSCFDATLPLARRCGSFICLLGVKSTAIHRSRAEKTTPQSEGARRVAKFDGTEKLIFATSVLVWVFISGKITKQNCILSFFFLLFHSFHRMKKNHAPRSSKMFRHTWNITTNIVESFSYLYSKECLVFGVILPVSD